MPFPEVGNGSGREREENECGKGGGLCLCRFVGRWAGVILRTCLLYLRFMSEYRAVSCLFGDCLDRYLQQGAGYSFMFLFSIVLEEM